MPPIHVDPEQLYLSARALWQDHLDMIDQIYALRSAMYRLEMAWQGGDAEEFIAEMSVLIQHLNEHAEQVLAMGLTLSHQGEMWDESDQRWTWNYRSTPQ
jgi:uncharacterized protein YukE